MVDCINDRGEGRGGGSAAEAEGGQSFGTRSVFVVPQQKTAGEEKKETPKEANDVAAGAAETVTGQEDVITPMGHDTVPKPKERDSTQEAEAKD